MRGTKSSSVGNKKTVNIISRITLAIVPFPNAFSYLFRFAVTRKIGADIKPKSNADRQREYRDRALKDPDRLILTRLQTMLSPSADGALKRIVTATGKTKREVVEMALLELEKTVTVKR